MRHALISSALVLSAVGCAGDSTSQGADYGINDTPVRFATYNIHHWVGDDDEVDVERIAEVIEQLDVDFVAVQEADNRPVDGDEEFGRQDLLAERLGWRWVEFDSGHGVPWLGVHGNAVLLSPDAELVSATYHDITQPDREPRAFTDTVVEARGQRVRLLGAHLGLNNRERRRQVRLIAREIGEGSDTDGTVVAGDFNEWNPLASTFSMLRNLMREVKTERTFPAGGPLFRLDRIWTSEHARFQQVQVIRTPTSVVASDHLPVRAEFVF